MNDFRFFDGYFASLFPLFLLGGLACTSAPEKKVEALVHPLSGSAVEISPTPPLAVATVANLISVNDVMVREPERFKKALCSDGDIYDLAWLGSRYSLRAEPLGVCVLFADTKSVRPSGFCGDARCEATMASECGDAEKKAAHAAFAKDQTVQRCWNIGSFEPLEFTVLISRVGQSCQAQTLVKLPEGWRAMSSIDGTYDSQKSAAGEGPGCWFESAGGKVFEGDWFGREKRVVPVMVFHRDGGSYALLKSAWGVSDNFQLFRLDGPKPQEIESFAESFKEPEPELFPPPLPSKDATPAQDGAAGDSPEKSPAKEGEIPESGVNPLEGDD